jgi:hypothetical protein
MISFTNIVHFFCVPDESTANEDAEDEYVRKWQVPVTGPSSRWTSFFLPSSLLSLQRYPQRHRAYDPAILL